MSVERVRLIQEWYERYGHGLYRRLCAAVRNPDEAQDISQETFLKVAVKLTNDEYGEVIHNPKAFLYRVAFNELYNRHKRHKLQSHLQVLFGETEFEVSHEMTPERETLSREELAVVNEAIDRLPEKQRQVFLMTRLEHMSHNDVALTLGIKKDTVKKHIVRVLTALRCVRAEYVNGEPGTRGEDNDG